MTIVCYESLAAEENVARAMLHRVRIEGPSSTFTGVMHSNSMLVWKRDTRYAFELDSRVAEVAAEFGYTPDQLTNHVKARRGITGSHLHR
jgi:hypothetical protein